MKEAYCFIGPYTEHIIKAFGETGIYLTDKSYYVI